MRKENQNAIHLFTELLLISFALFILSLYLQSIESSKVSNHLLSLSLITFGAAVSSFAGVLKDHLEEKSTYRPFNCKVKGGDRKKMLPLFIAVNVGGCITPPDRTEIDLRKFQRLRCYCEHVRKNHERKFPPIVIYTGRSQGYVELLAQSLGMVENSMDLPFVIENGSALYYPASKKTIPLTSPNQNKWIQEVHRILADELGENTFEPKVGMITINAIKGETIGELEHKVAKKMKTCRKNVFDKLKIHTTASAVDITPEGIDKISGLKETLAVYHSLRPESEDKSLEDVVAIVNDTSDLDIINEVCNAYCSKQNAPHEVKQAIAEKFGKDNIIESDQIDLVMEVIVRETGLRVV